MKNLKQSSLLYLGLAIIILFSSSCATIVGGSRYNAHIRVPKHPQAAIIVNGKLCGTGFANVKIKRSKANKLSITVKDLGCDSLTVNYVSRTFRGGALVGTIFGWTGLYNGIPLPWGAIVDLSTGALWKPSVKEEGISKLSYKDYFYLINYEGCKTSN
jgi:hypothetical protein